MAALDFPSSPTLNQQYSNGTTTWAWDGTAWNIIPQMGPMFISDTPPPNPAVGQEWWRSSNGQMYIWYQDQNSSQWVQSAGAVGEKDAPYPFALADMVLKSKAAGSVVLNNKKDGSGTDVATFGTNGDFTASGAVWSSQYFASSGLNVVLSGQNGGAIYLRPQGPSSTAGQATIDATGNLSTSAQIVAANGITGVNNIIVKSDASPAVSLQSAAGANRGQLYASGQNILLANNPIGTSMTMRSDGYLILSHTYAAKPGGGPWSDTSDERIKTVVGNYERGLAEIVALQPVRYTFKGNDTYDEPEGDAAPYENSGHLSAATDGTVFIGMIAQAVETVMPEMVVMGNGYIDGEAVTDLRNLDTTPLIFALINAVKTLAAKVDALEARP